jgi:hypothetical protein
MKSLDNGKRLTAPEKVFFDQSFLSGPSRRFQPTGDGGGGGGCSNLELCSEADVYLGCRDDSIALAMSWLKVDEARTEGRKLTWGILAAERVEAKCELGEKLGNEEKEELQKIRKKQGNLWGLGVSRK